MALLLCMHFQHGVDMNNPHPSLSTVRRRAQARISRLTKERALEILAELRADGATIEHPAIRQLTGGFASQSLNQVVTRMLATKAGYFDRAST